MLVLDSVALRLGTRDWYFDFTLETRGCYALLGRSGSGKSTLLNLLGGFLQPDSGNILWNQTSITQLKPAERPVTTLFQQDNLFQHLTVMQNIGLGIDPGLRLSTQQRKEISNTLLDVGLGGFETKMPGTLSGGEQQRVALARCLLRNNPILLLDEPFSALDTATRQEMIGLLKSLISHYDLCVLIVTHDRSDAAAIDARILNMNKGTVTFE